MSAVASAVTSTVTIAGIEISSVTVSIAAALISLGSLIVSYWNARRQTNLTRALKSQEREFERKKFVTVLWDKMTEVAELHPDEQGKYDETDIFYALSTLELVAICWACGLVDRNLLFLVWGDSFRLRVKEIEGIERPLQVLRKTGPELLRDRQVIMNVRDEMNEMAKKKGIPESKEGSI